MRSRLVADFAASLDLGGARWKYAPELFRNHSFEWLPDFRLDGEKNPRFIEVQPVEFFIDGHDGDDAVYRIDSTIERMEIARTRHPKAHLVLVGWRYGAENYVVYMESMVGGTGWIYHDEGIIVPTAFAWHRP